MNLIDGREKEIIKKKADDIHKSLKTVSGPNSVLDDSIDYGFDTPIQFQKALEDMWLKLGKKDMEIFIPIVTASAFKNREKSVMMQDISVFNYEF